MRDVIRVMDVSKSFGEETVLHHISYDFKEGRIYGIVGNNGSGKTVLYCVITRVEVNQLKRIIRNADVSAFVTISEVSEIIGNHIKNSSAIDEKSAKR